MRAITSIIVALVACAFANETSIYVGMQGLKIICDTELKLKFVRQFESIPDFDFLRLARNPKIPVDVLVPASHLETFKRNLTKNNIGYEIFIEDVNEIIQKSLAEQRNAYLRKDSNDILKSYPRYEEIQRYLKELSQTHSDVVTYFSIGKSFEGRDIGGVKISSGGSNKPVVFIDAGIHAREWLAPTTAIYAIQQLVENSTNSYLYENVDFYIIPSLNADGYVFTHDHNRMWRKTRSVNPMSECFGTDGNRNFDYYWNTVGASINPCSDIYAGSKAFSEPETAALRDFMLTLKNIKVYLTLHSYGQYILYPWSYTEKAPDNEAEHLCAAETAELALSKVRGTRYEVGCSTVVLYASAGSSDDWALGVAGAELSYTIELPGGQWGFAPPPSEIKLVGEETFEAFKVFIQYAEDKICNDVSK